MMFRDGFFHCDPHPGNLMLIDGEWIGIIDFGMHRRIAPEVLAAVRKNVLASVRRDPDLYAASLVETGFPDAWVVSDRIVQRKFIRVRPLEPPRRED
jgi:predicted unusual protein kinase regulating ubiquinone biosynthesis (AarF/ABC1/UbiB family)